MFFIEISTTFFNLETRFVRPKDDNKGNSEYFASVESPVQFRKQCRKPRCIFQHCRSTISAHRASALSIQFVFCKNVFQKLKYMLFFGCWLQFLTEKEVLLYGTFMEIPHQHGRRKGAARRPRPP